MNTFKCDYDAAIEAQKFHFKAAMSEVIQLQTVEPLQGRDTPTNGDCAQGAAFDSSAFSMQDTGDGFSFPPPGNCDEDLDSDIQPTGERWPPLGAPNDDDDNSSLGSFSEAGWLGQRSSGSGADFERLKELEEEQEQLNSSLFALTSHFAQVQFRLKQIVDASPKEKEALLIDLEEFANRGIPDLRCPSSKSINLETEDSESKLDVGHERQKQLIEKLKVQLEDLEHYAYQTGEAGLPQSIILEKQKVVIDQLKRKINLNVDNFDKLSIDELKSQVDHAVKELVNPLRMKEQLVSQLQTQIVDLERFIEFLQDGGPDPSLESIPPSDCKCDGHVQPESVGGSSGRMGGGPRSVPPGRKANSFKRHQLKQDTETLISRAATLLSMLTFAQFGCGSQRFERNSLKKQPTGYHWGDIRATLELAITSVLEIAGPLLAEDSDYTSDSEEMEQIIRMKQSLTLCVRKELCPALRDLIQHGLMPVGQSQSLVPFLSCLPHRSTKPGSGKMLHAWDLIIEFYKLKRGDQYNKTPARRLSQSFNLDISGSAPTTSKQLLLQTIGNILSTHGPLKRSSDSHFKAFVCSALNQNKLVAWLRMIFRTQVLLENFYQPWSYVARTGFEDAFRALERLNKLNFDLAVDLAVRPFQNIKDVF